MTQVQTRLMNGKGCKQNLDRDSYLPVHSNFASEYRSSVVIDPLTCQCGSSPRWIKPGPKMAAAVKKFKLLRLQTSLLRVEVAVARQRQDKEIVA